jgi:hypothetical protein
LRRFATVVILALALAACGADGAAGPLGDTPVDVDAALRLIVSGDIESVGGDGSGLDRSVIDFRAVVAEMSPEQVEPIATWHSVSFGEGDFAPALALSIIEYHDRDAAAHAMDLFEAGLAFVPMTSSVSERSAASVPSADTGAAIVLLKGVRLVSIQLPLDIGGTPLLDERQLLALAELVATRL